MPPGLGSCAHTICDELLRPVERFGMSALQLLDQELDIGGDGFLFGGGLLAVDGGALSVVDKVFMLSAPLLRLLHVRVERGMYMPNATWRRRG
jgi:hypothetical protein